MFWLVWQGHKMNGPLIVSRVFSFVSREGGHLWPGVNPIKPFYALKGKLQLLFAGTLGYCDKNKNVFYTIKLKLSWL